ncbi:MAG: NigD-like N-terminal domain-containing protein [Prevotella sp.]|nr:NigD-like N-terminal domain-containing protein [Prevotella sp.]
MVYKIWMYAILLLLLASCESDSYDKGEGELSLATAEFVEAHANGDKQMDYVITDNDERLTVSPQPSVKWMTTPDSLYRALLYYNNVGEGIIEPLSITQVPTLSIYPDWMIQDIKTDPVTFESIWQSANGKYLNMAFYLKIGEVGKDAELHTISIIQDTIIQNADGTATSFMCLYHDQGDMPEHYSSKCYISIPRDSIKADSVCMGINTYKGVLYKKVALR